MRDTPFSWTYVLQRPRTGDTAVVNCTIVVFENRSLLMANLGSQQRCKGPEQAYFGQAAAGVNTAQFNRGEQHDYAHRAGAAECFSGGLVV